MLDDLIVVFRKNAAYVKRSKALESSAIYFFSLKSKQYKGVFRGLTYAGVKKMKLNDFMSWTNSSVSQHQRPWNVYLLNKLLSYVKSDFGRMTEFSVFVAKLVRLIAKRICSCKNVEIYCVNERIVMICPNRVELYSPKAYHEFFRSQFVCNECKLKALDCVSPRTLAEIAIS